MLRPLLSLLALLCVAGAPAPQGQPRAIGSTSIDIDIRAVPLNAEMPQERRLGKLIYMGGLELVSPNVDFGGLSGLAVAADESHFLSITDTGRWVCGTLSTGDDGTLQGVSHAWMADMKSPDGFKVKRRKDLDSEALSISPDGKQAYVAFEGRHRIWRYSIDDPTDLCTAASAKPSRVPLPAQVSKLPYNGGIEGLAITPGGTAILIGEHALRKINVQPGWTGPLDADAPENLKPFTYASTAPFSPTDLEATKDGVFIMHRHFSVLSGVSGMIGWVPLEGFKPMAMNITSQALAQLAPPVSVDNFEGLSAVPDGKGGYTLYIVSDDNFSPFQRTLLLKFHLRSNRLNALKGKP